MPAKIYPFKWTPSESLAIIAVLTHRPFCKMEQPDSRGSTRPQNQDESSTSTPCWLQAPRALTKHFFIPSDWVPPPAAKFPGALCWASFPAWWHNASQACTGPDTNALQHGGNQRTSFSNKALLSLLCRQSGQTRACLKGWLGVASSSGVKLCGLSPFLVLGIWRAE